ncbi:MAG TPA: cupin domain-containing protein [Vicinamibacteria bacterium]|nr:cupin domain-containing protein [Vicinamibacteria bacterium]
MAGDDCRLIGAHALGALEGDDRERLDAHVASCEACARALAGASEALTDLAAAIPPRSSLRQRVLDMAEAPALPIDPAAYAWEELAPGVRVHTVREDPSRSFRSVLVWASPGARYPRHRHLGDEEILVLSGRLRDERGSYGPGEICRSVTGTDHSEEVEGAEDCICYVIYRGDHEMLE